MKKHDIYIGTVDKVKFPDKGIITSSYPAVQEENGAYTQTSGQPETDCPVTVKNTIPGQKVCFAVKKKRKGKAEGHLLRTLEKSPLELETSCCHHFGICGGCNYQTLPYEEQLRLKSSQVLELMRDVIPGADAIFEGIKASPRKNGYRNKMEYTFGDERKDGPLTVGMHKRGGFYDIVTVDQCRIVDTDYRKILLTTQEYFRRMGTTFYHRMRHEGYLRHLLVRKAVKTSEILVDLVTTTQEQPQERELLEDWKETLLGLELEGTVAGILHTKNDSVADAVKNEGTEILYGQDYFYEELLGLKFKISPFSFFQTNSLGAEVLYDTARTFIREALEADHQNLRGKVVYDLYSGTGTIAQMLASVSGKVVGVEIVEEAVEAAKENAALNQLDNCEFIAGDVLKVLDTIEEKPDFIVLDPPREGIHPKALDKIIRYGVDKMIYISCKPTSLQRDLEILQERGYRAERICCVDLFPGTVHVETVVLLSKGEIDSKKVRVEFSLEGMDMSVFQKGATYEQIKAYVLEHSGLKVSSLYISQIKRKCGLDMGQNYNLSKKEDAKVPQCPPEKEAAIMEALKHFQMI